MGGRDGLACGKPLPRWGQRFITMILGTGLSGESVSLTVVIHSDSRQTVLR